MREMSGLGSAANQALAWAQARFFGMGVGGFSIYLSCLFFLMWHTVLEIKASARLCRARERALRGLDPCAAACGLRLRRQ